MKIYTRTGDKGMTSLIGGKKVSKSAVRIESYGDVDELNAHIGLLGDLDLNAGRRAVLREIQDRLFTIGANLALAPEKNSNRIPDLIEEDILLLESQIDEMQERVPPLRSFILPGGHQYVSFGHLARTVCRRAERAVVRLSETEPVDEIVIRYLNRLSDYLFVMTRVMSAELGAEEICWTPRL
ncbi:MAG: ATP:cob(I)alamin adenosyltransferase [Cytophagaceae bacterium SCN 52-12]|nr:MAG: ATP:cob(I)alamin adenosyltransferase [Cytophagaceae bacterium SCN 52-12]